jgi:hypothetical protein
MLIVVVLRLRRFFWLADWQGCDVMNLSGIIFTGGPLVMTRWAPVVVHGGVPTERVYQVRGMRIAGRTRYELHGGPVLPGQGLGNGERLLAGGTDAEQQRAAFLDEHGRTISTRTERLPAGAAADRWQVRALRHAPPACGRNQPSPVFGGSRHDRG